MTPPDRVESVAFLAAILAAVVLAVGSPLLLAHRAGIVTAQECERISQSSSQNVPQIMALALALIALRKDHGARPPS